MKKGQVLHEKQKTKMHHKNISQEHFSFTNFDPKLCADTDSKLIKLLNDFCCTKNSQQYYENKKLVITTFSFFLQTLNSNFRLSANSAQVNIQIFLHKSFSL